MDEESKLTNVDEFIKEVSTQWEAQNPTVANLIRQLLESELGQIRTYHKPAAIGARFEYFDETKPPINMYEIDLADVRRGEG